MIVLVLYWPLLFLFILLYAVIFGVVGWHTSYQEERLAVFKTLIAAQLTALVIVLALAHNS